MKFSISDKDIFENNFQESESELYIDPRAYTSDIEFPDPSQFRIYDTTLRDGEQTPGVALTAPQKYEIAKMISRLGCHILDMGFPAAHPSESEALRMVLDGKHKGEIRQDLEILVMCRANHKDIDHTLEVLRGVGAAPNEITFLIFTSASNLHLKYKLGSMFLKEAGLSPDKLNEMPLEWFRERNEIMIRDAISYARSCGIEEVEFGTEDASRTPVEQLISLVRSGVEAGATRYIFPDTTGSLTPESTAYYCKRLRAAFPDLPMVSHFHNDYSLVTANVITSCRYGMSSFGVTLNGIGERAGNAPLHSVVVALKMLYGIDIPGFQYHLLCEASELVERLTGIMTQAHEPIVGRNVFAHETGIHTHGILHHPKTYEPINADLVGGNRHFVYGKHSGSNLIKHILEKARTRIESSGKELTEELVAHVLREVKSVRIQRAETEKTSDMVKELRVHLKGIGLTEEDVLAIAESIEVGSL